MTKHSHEFNKPNAAWILHREEIDTVRDGYCNIYVLLDAYSTYCFGQESSIDLPAPKKINALLKQGFEKAGAWPGKIVVLKKDPYAENLKPICRALNLPMAELTTTEIEPYLRPFKESFAEFKGGSSPPPLSDDEREELETFIPESYGPCPCASGKKFKFCCQKAFKEITFAMCAAQEGQLNEALAHMKQAERKVGRTAEIVCRYGICWSFFDMKKSQEYLSESLALNPNHPRANYCLGIEAMAEKKFDEAVRYYHTAIANYPESDKFHLNETYNNLGTAYFELKRYEEAKEVWEKALVLIPTDRMVIENLFEFIYGNPTLPPAIREISPFIEKYLERRRG